MSRTVLIVDDHDGFRAGARALLEADGFEVVGEAADGAAALEEVRRLRPEVVLLDVQLPGIDGFEVAERLAAERDARQQRPAQRRQETSSARHSPESSPLAIKPRTGLVASCRR